MTDKSIIWVCKNDVVYDQDMKHYISANSMERCECDLKPFIPLTAIKSLIRGRKEEYQANAVKENIGVMEASVIIGRCAELESLLTHLEEMEK